MQKGIEQYLGQFPSPNRAETVTLALCQLGQRAGVMLMVMCRLAWEAHEHGYWSKVSRGNGTPYESEETYFKEILQVQTWRSAFKRIAVGRAMAALPEPIQDMTQRGLAAVGLAKATILAPALEQAESEREVRWWLDQAADYSPEELQAAVSAAVGARARGVAPDADRIRNRLAALMPDIESRELLEQLLAVGRQVVDSDNPLAIVLAAFREALASWLPHVASLGALAPVPREATLTRRPP